jgi:hypothetical protein
MLGLALVLAVVAFPVVLAFAFAIARDGSPFRRSFWS